MKVGDLVTLDASTRKNGRLAGKLGLIIDTVRHGGYVVSVAGQVKKFHTSQISAGGCSD